MSSEQQSEFRAYQDHQNDPVAAFYRTNHEFQTLDFARSKLTQYAGLNRKQMSVWDAIFELDQIQDSSDPDTELSQLDHSLQTAEAIRAAGHPKWLQLTGLIHDLGKVLCTFGEPQWAVVGDTFPLGCRFDESIVYYEFFHANPDYQSSEYQTATGIYAPNCGLDAVTMSWGHDEYLYRVTQAFLPPEALYVIRYHSFYSAHSAGAYEFLFDAQDERYMPWVKTFQPFDLYSKAEDPPDRDALLPYYQQLVAEFLPEHLHW